MFAALLSGASGAGAESLSLNQCANGAIDDGVDHLQCYEGWTGGNVNAQKATLLEGDFLPYRVALTDLMVGQQYTYSFSWDTAKDEQHAIDYIGTFNHTVVNADACQGLSAAICTGTVGTAAIPADPDLGFVPIAGQFTLFGGTIDSVGAYFTPGTDVRAISVTFTPDQASAILAWGGHISSPLDWGDGTTAADIHGSPYHVSNISLKKGDVVVAGGGQDVALSAGAVYVPSAINVLKTANKDGTFTFESYHGQQAMTPEGDLNPWTLERNQQKSMMAFDDGTATITETNLPEGDWRIGSITCSRVNTGVVFSYQYGQGSEADSAVFDTDEGGTYNCVFDNEFFGAPVLDVIKKVIGPDDACTDAVRDGDGNETRSIRSGESVKYCYWITNNGSDAALDVTLLDDMGTADTGDDQMIALSGGSDIDGQLDALDLASGEQASGSLVTTHNIPLNTTVTNVAEATGTGQTDGLPVSDQDTANVVANQASNCALSATASVTGSCPGNPTVWALEGDAITWCANVGWDAGAVLPLTDIAIAMIEDNSVSTLHAPMNPGATDMVLVGSNVAGANDFTGTLQLTGMEGGLNPIQCASQATVDVVAPGLNLLKTVMPAGGTCGVDDRSSISVIIGDAVQYCLVVANTGDTPLNEVWVEDSLISVAYSPSGGILADGEFSYYTSQPFTPTETVTNTAVATAMEPLTRTPMGPEMSSATVEVLYADVALEKSVDLLGITICEFEGQNPFCTPDPEGDGLFPATYTITVEVADGNTPATDVTISDTLPAGFSYTGNDSGCDDSNLPTLICNVGDLALGESVTINVFGQIDTNSFELPWGRITNEACANTDPAQLDPNPSNNCDDAVTSFGTGPARSAGYWGTHPDALGWCTDRDDINLGYMTIPSIGERADDEVDAYISTDVNANGKWASSMMIAQPRGDNDLIAATAVEMAKGGINYNRRWNDGTQRSYLDAARAKASRQVIAAWCNEQMGSSFAVWLDGWEAVQSILAGRGYLDNGVYVSCAGYCPSTPTMLRQVVDSMDYLAWAADQYNNSGHHLPMPDEVPQGPADPHYPQTDPTDPTDSVNPAAAASATTAESSATSAKAKGQGKAKK